MSEIVSAAVSIAFHGVAFAMVLYLISVGLSVTMGLMGFVNLAHGVFAAAGGYVMTTLFNDYGVPFAPAVAIAAVVVGVASVALERTLYRRLYGGDELDQVLMTIALVFISVAAAKYIWGSEQAPMHPPALLAGHVELLGREFPTYRSFVIVAGVVLVTLLWLGLDRTRLGAKIRAAVDNRRMAQSVGIDTSGLFSFTFALGTGLAALGGALGAELLPVFPGYALDNLILFLIVVSVGGLGTIRGPFFAALLLGVADTAFKYLLPQFGSFFIYALTLAILLIRPKGLFGQIGRA
ncbi:MAG TPA: branched-chain amino acid ABC transporter permease [Stellaceae bacterium]|nr:branched-chain amino acid ABC transporter permease [Stellaceae bacterium]